ncbi:cell division protein FtsX [Sulfurimonas sp. C5]|uniref:cell division protein FtsX n=1 Tax=Sulfurimonas sp. C5 TaxID=3036947 RepID=UPI0024561F2F|nr:cell division protein FtsX [Sulfurimonas sp. C5]MDH4943678.1 cell division protein FtsX [Sulfurimonas sp. C5]
MIVERSIDTYKENLANNYALVIVSEKNLETKQLIAINPLVANVEALSPDNIITKLNAGISKTNMELLKVTLPKFYKVSLEHYPSPAELKKLTKSFLSNQYITKVETFEKTHDTTYRLLVLFKNVITVFAFTVAIVTILLISKELRIWQFKHNERMSIMGLFGAPSWLRSAVLFRLAIVDALIASFLAFIIFAYIESMPIIAQEFQHIGIKIVFFDHLYDSLLMLGVSISVSIMLAMFVVLGHKEEV